MILVGIKVWIDFAGWPSLYLSVSVSSQTVKTCRASKVETSHKSTIGVTVKCDGVCLCVSLLTDCMLGLAQRRAYIRSAG